MYLNESNGLSGLGDGNGNGNEHKKRVSFAEMRAGLETIEGNDLKSGERVNETGGGEPVGARTDTRSSARQGGETRAAGSHPNSASAGEDSDESNVLIDEEDAPLYADERDENERRGGRRRRWLALGIAASVCLFLAFIGLLWIVRGSGEEYRVRSPGAGRSSSDSGGAGKTGDATQALTAEEIRTELDRARANANSNGSPGEQGTSTNPNQQSNEVAGEGSPVTDRLPLGDYSTTVIQPPSSALSPSSSPAMSASQTSAASSTGQMTATDDRKAFTSEAGRERQGSPSAERSIRINANQ